jgi:hypothetical protein
MFDFLGDLLGLNKGKATKIAANQNTGLIRQYDDRGSNIIQGGANEAADQSYGSWLDRLGGMSSTALSGQTGALNNLANLATGTASQKLGLAGDVTSGLLGANNQYAQGEEANKAGIASLGSNLIGMAGKAFGWGGF